jgi:hypothetical protein
MTMHPTILERLVASRQEDLRRHLDRPRPSSERRSWRQRLGVLFMRVGARLAAVPSVSPGPEPPSLPCGEPAV